VDVPMAVLKSLILLISQSMVAVVIYDSRFSTMPRFADVARELIHAFVSMFTDDWRERHDT
jgi:hypothetical protein